MSLTIIPKQYKVALKNNEYVDNFFIVIPNEGLKCPCREKSSTIFYSRTNLKNHFKTKTHKKWLQQLNQESQTDDVYRYKFQELSIQLRDKNKLLNEYHIKNQQLQQRMQHLAIILSEKQEKITELEEYIHRIERNNKKNVTFNLNN